MPKSYSQLRAAFALAKASLLAMLRSPTSIVFSLLFPIIFIIVFGSMVDTTIVPLKISVGPNSDTSNVIFESVKKIKNLTIVPNMSQDEAQEALQKGRLTAILRIKKNPIFSQLPPYTILITSSPSSADAGVLLQTLLNNVVGSIDKAAFPSNSSVAILHTKELPGRVYRKIDFILPGQLGLSLLMAGVFGSAFLLFNLRQGLVLKRLSATPIKRSYIILGEMLSRLSFHVLSFIIMVGLGYFAFNYTLVNGLLTFFEMLLFSLFGLVIFMGIGFIISGVIQNESSVAPTANTFILPQILLCGLFFPIENYPHGLQAFCNILPLTLFVDGLRKIGFEGAHIWQLPWQVIGLIIWATALSVVAVKLFKWE
ncbi:ABC transporter permease [Pinibacter soli]|uniref:ABC transporter permease n=1 Tax=Pinibacter soli TaxID=3044211 RepID=A0ABT6RJ37_9BACT|nr:ABC transporter permease [Pinibacter soli]MDI3321857.1 ABC transporter permease [Pinibacter soli]